MPPRKRLVLSGLMGVVAAMLFLLVQNAIHNWLLNYREIGGLVDLVLFGPGLYTGNANWHVPVTNNGGLLASLFVVLTSICFCWLTILFPEGLAEQEGSGIKKLLRILRAAASGAIAGAVLMTVCTWIGLFLVSEQDSRLIRSKSNSIVAAIVIGLVYGMFAGGLIGSLWNCNKGGGNDDRL